MFVIGVAGQAQMGKDTLADHICPILNEGRIRFSEADWPHFGKISLPPMEWTRAAFAANVKKVYEDTFGVDRAFVEEWKVKDEIPPGFDMTCRQGLQFIGDGFRKIRSSIWLDLCFRDDVPKIISDVRYINEFKRIRQEGGLNILVGCTEKLNDDPNGSEAIIRPYCEWALNNLKDGGADQLMISRIMGSEMDGAPPDMNLFDLFVRNDGTKEEFYEKIENEVVLFVEKFKFKGK